jgi:hypothetical protein
MRKVHNQQIDHRTNLVVIPSRRELLHDSLDLYTRTHTRRDRYTHKSSKIQQTLPKTLETKTDQSGKQKGPQERHSCASRRACRRDCEARRQE